MRLVKCLFYLVPILLASRGFSQGTPAPGPSIKKPLIYQVGQIVHITTGGSRPLLQAVDALQEKYGWIVDYEDPRYPPAISGATIPAPGPVRRHPNTRTNGTTGFSVQFNGGPTADSRPDEQTVLALVVDANNQSNNAGQFELRKEKDGSFVVVGVGGARPERREFKPAAHSRFTHQSYSGAEKCASDNCPHLPEGKPTEQDSSHCR